MLEVIYTPLPFSMRPHSWLSFPLSTEFSSAQEKQNACSTYLRTFGVPCVDRLVYPEDAAVKTTLIATNLPFILTPDGRKMHRTIASMTWSNAGQHTPTFREWRFPHAVLLLPQKLPAYYHLHWSTKPRLRAIILGFAVSE